VSETGWSLGYFNDVLDDHNGFGAVGAVGVDDASACGYKGCHGGQ